MFLKHVGKATKIKKAAYLIASTILGLTLSLIAHALIEIKYINWVLSRGQMVTFYNGCALHPIFQVSLWIIGGVGGFLLGRFWWQKIYIERLWSQK